MAGSFEEYSTRYISRSFGFAIGWNYWYKLGHHGGRRARGRRAGDALLVPGRSRGHWSAVFLVILFALNA
ncbi:hypothetical protein QJS66_16435 [Kocuria rhizophila]|nr:hypothetical protein QJS66_16435 [Kocuria rhizophila]